MVTSFRSRQLWWVPELLVLFSNLPCAVSVVVSGEVVLAIDNGYVGLSTRGASAFRLRFISQRSQLAYESPLLSPGTNADFISKEDGISAGFGAVTVVDGKVIVEGPKGNKITESSSITPGVVKLGGEGILFGGGASPADAEQITVSKGTTVEAFVCNRATAAPFYYSTAGYAALGVLNNSRKNRLPISFTNEGDGVKWAYDPKRHDFELYLMPAASFKEGSLAYYSLVGTPAVLPRYAFGFIVSRWGWKDKWYMESIMERFREDHYPIDAIILDFEWFTTQTDYPFGPGEGFDWYQDFGTNKDMFDDFEGQTSRYLDEYHIHFGGIRKPRLGNTELIEQAAAKGWILQNGEPGGAYPPEWENEYSQGRYLDFAQMEVRDWYAEQMAPLYAQGAAFWWNDEGEGDYFTNHWWNVAESQALEAVDGNKRFYSLNRAWSPGMARLGAAVWTGDIGASWNDLHQTPGMMLNWIVAGAPYVACDIGGFLGNTTSFMLARWMQLGSFMPQMRVHSVIDAIPHWPWRFGDNAAYVIKQALELRYRLSTYHYSWAHQMYRNKALWMRPLAMDFPEDEHAVNISTQWMVGDILVAPMLDEKPPHEVYLPEGTWYELFTKDIRTGPSKRRENSALDDIPAFVQPGTIVVLAPAIQHMGALPGGPLEVHVYAGSDGEFEMVEDDGKTYAYKNGEVRNTLFKWDDSALELSWKASGSLLAAGEHTFTQVLATVFNGPKSLVHKLPLMDLGDSGSVRVPVEETEALPEYV